MRVSSNLIRIAHTPSTISISRDKLNFARLYSSHRNKGQLKYFVWVSLIYEKSSWAEKVRQTLHSNEFARFLPKMSCHRQPFLGWRRFFFRVTRPFTEWLPVFLEWPDFLNFDTTFLRVTPIMFWNWRRFFQSNPNFLFVTKDSFPITFLEG